MPNPEPAGVIRPVFKWGSAPPLRGSPEYLGTVKRKKAFPLSRPKYPRGRVRSTPGAGSPRLRCQSRTAATARASTGTVAVFSPAMLIRLSPIM